MKNRLGHLLWVCAAAWGSGCSGASASLADLPCENGHCVSGYACHPETGTCVPELAVGCDGEGTCPSATRTGDPCSSVGSFLPCEDGVTDCSAGCRTCLADGVWSECSGPSCTLGLPSSCASCDDDCGTRIQNADPLCDATRACDYDTCNDGYSDIDGVRSNGCECGPASADLPCNEIDEDCSGADAVATGELQNCAGCGDDCTARVAHATGVLCADRLCDYETCAPGFVDLDEVRQNGCECSTTNLGVETCDGEDNDCSGVADDMDAQAVNADCERLVAVPASHVATWGCDTACVVETCSTDYYDENGEASDGCEYHCAPSAPGTEICDGEDNDCDGTVDNVVDLQSDCSARVSNPQHVVEWVCGDTGTCDVGRCDAGWSDINDTGDDGCEAACTPDPPERCDGEDNDCDGAVDDPGADGCTLFFRDEDDDGAGVAGDSQCLCAAAGSYTASVTGDCDDGDANNWTSCSTCNDGDTDSYYAGCDAYVTVSGPDCDDADANNWTSCGTCSDGDTDSYYVGCDAYVTVSGPDCDDGDANNWTSCATCNDGDTDSYYAGCDAYVTVSGPDCDDGDANNWTSCATCNDGDTDSYYAGCDAYVTVAGPDCDDGDTNNWTSCGTCNDGDTDSYYVGCDAYVTVSGPDCDDGDANNWTSCGTCDDGDTDSYYAGCDAYVTVAGPDCDDGDANNWTSCGTCSDGDTDSYYAGCDAYVTVSGPDCNDDNAAVHPNATEGPQGDATCYDTEDNDCDTLTNNQDTDCWWDSSWGGRIRLTLDNAARSEDLVDFPVLVVLDRSRIDYARVQDSGQDLRFIAADGTELSYEIEQWDEGPSTTWVYEAENPATEQSLDGVHTWELRDTLVGYSRSGYREALPNSGTACGTNITTCGAELTYDFTVPAGTYYVHFRISATNGLDDSLSWGVGGTLWEQLHTNPDDGTWAWNTGGLGINAPAGTFTLNVWMREDGQKLDQIVIGDSATPPSSIAQDGVSFVWVRVPAIPAGSTDTTIWMYYDNPSAAAGQDPGAVWDSSYAAVWHLKEDPTAPAPQFADSTLFGNDATAQGSISADRLIDAQVGGGLDLDGNNDYLRVCVDNCPTSLRITGNAFTLEAWARIGAAGVAFTKSLIDKHFLGNDERFFLGISAPDQIACRATTTFGHYRFSTAAIPTQAWSYIVCRYDGSLTTSQLQGWVNGAHVGSTSTFGNVADTAWDDLLLGKRFNASYYEGWFDELRISNIARSDSYIEAQHESMRDQLITFGVEETP